MNEIKRAGISLFIIALSAAALLGTTNYFTKPVIALNTEKAKKAAMAEVLPNVRDNNFSNEFLTEPAPATGVTSYAIGYDGDTAVGYALILKQLGYSGNITMLVGLDTNGVVTGLKIIEHSETPGLGAKAVTEGFRGQFAGKNDEILVTKNSEPKSNEIVAITSATITSRAVTSGVNAAIEFYKSNLSEE